MKFTSNDPHPRNWHRVFAFFPVPLFHERWHGRRAWFEVVERRYPDWTTTAGPIAVYRPIGSDWDVTGERRDRTADQSSPITDGKTCVLIKDARADDLPPPPMRPRAPQ